ncbi:MAG: O-antigen ligase family protein [Gemmatimonadaceae bacterium]
MPPAAFATAGVQEQPPDRLLKALGWMLFAYIWRLQDVLPALGKIQLPLLVAGITIMFFISSRQRIRSLKLVRSRLLSLGVILFAIMLIGVPMSLWPARSLSFAIKSESENLVLMALIAASVRSMRDIEWLTKINLYGALFFSLMVSLFFKVGSDGRLSNLVFYDANDFALVMVVTIPFALYFLRAGNERKGRLLGLISLGFILLGIVKSGSRGGFIALIAVMIYVLVRYRSIPRKVRMSIALAGVAFIAVLGSDKYWTQISTIANPEGDYNWTDPVGRKAVWERGLGYVEHSPIFGVGLRAFPIAEGESDLARSLSAQNHGFKWSVAHNSFLETAAELGIPGLIVFVSFFVVSIRTLIAVKPGGKYGPWVTSREQAIAQMLVGSFLGFMIAGVFVSAEYFSYLYFLLGMVIGLDKILRLRRDAAWAALAMARPVRLGGPQPMPLAGPVRFPLPAP